MIIRQLYMFDFLLWIIMEIGEKLKSCLAVLENSTTFDT